MESDNSFNNSEVSLIFYKLNIILEKYFIIILFLIKKI